MDIHIPVWLLWTRPGRPLLRLLLLPRPFGPRRRLLAHHPQLRRLAPPLRPRHLARQPRPQPLEARLSSDQKCHPGGRLLGAQIRPGPPLGLVCSEARRPHLHPHPRSASHLPSPLDSRHCRARGPLRGLPAALRLERPHSDRLGLRLLAVPRRPRLHRRPGALPTLRPKAASLHLGRAVLGGASLGASLQLALLGRARLTRQWIRIPHS